MKATPQVLSAFADKAKGVLVETHRLNAAEWDTVRAERHQEELRSLGDYAGNLGLDAVQGAILDLYAYVSVFTEGTLKPNSAQRAELERLTQDAQAAILELTPGMPALTGSIVYLLAPTIEVPSSLSAALRQEGLQLAIFQDGDSFSTGLHTHLPQAVLAEAGFVSAVSEILDSLSMNTPEATRLPLIGVDNGDSSARLQSLIGGADLFLPNLDDPTVGTQIKELLANQNTEPFRVLVVDDDRQISTFCEFVLGRAGMRVESVNDAAQVHARVEAFKPDLVLMDLYMPGADGLTLTAQLRQHANAVVLPIVFLSGEHSEEARFQAIQVGGDDFLTKPIRPRHLVAAVRSRIKRVRALGKQLQRRPGDAHGYMRRGAFLDYLRDLRQRPSGSPIALLVITLDQASELQERLSLSVGHELEQAVALRLSETFETGDCYCLIQEFGFGVCIERAQRDALLQTAERLRAAVADQPFKIEGVDTRLTVSVGLALMPRMDRSIDDWISAAFAAARTGARLGGNRVEGILATATAGMSPERLMRIRELLRDATSPRGMVIDYQPLIPLRGSETGRYAMVMHLRHLKEPLTGVSRSEFLPVARELKMQGPIDRVVISRALQSLDDQRARNRVTDLLVPVDFASIDREQLTWIQGEISKRRQSEQRLTLEFEASMLVESGHAARLLERLRAEGVRLAAVDRSGRLAHIEALTRLPLNTMRLPAAALQATDPTILGPMLQGWYRGGRELIAEDVRDLGIIAKLWNLGVDYLQGDVLATPGPRLDFDFSEISLA